jgi:hypothetical protein
MPTPSHIADPTRLEEPMTALEANTRSVEMLRNVPSLRSLADTDLARIAAVLGERLVAAGQVLVAEGTTGDQSYLIVDGMATVEAGGVPIASIGPGDFVGELALLTDEPRCATVRSQTPMHVLVLDKSTLRTLIDPVAEALLGTLARRLRRQSGSDARRGDNTGEAGAVSPIGTAVAVRSRYDGRWVDGFEIADVDLSGEIARVQVRRRSDGAVLPMAFGAEDVRAV